MARVDGLPLWVAPDAFAVSDVSCLALRGLVEGCAREECAGMVAALGWVAGVLPSPVTGRCDGAVDERLAVAESWTAASARPGSYTPPLAEVSRVLGVEYREPAAVDPEFALGVCATLRWLSGRDDTPPLPIPVRTPDGTPAAESYVFARLLAAAGPVDAATRMDLRVEASRIATESARLAGLVAETVLRARGVS